MTLASSSSLSFAGPAWDSRRLRSRAARAAAGERRICERRCLKLLQAGSALTFNARTKLQGNLCIAHTKSGKRFVMSLEKEPTSGTCFFLFLLFCRSAKQHDLMPESFLSWRALVSGLVGALGAIVIYKAVDHLHYSGIFRKAKSRA